MPTATKEAPKAAPKKEKRDFKQEFLNYVDKTHGLAAAMAMESLVKKQDKKFEDYMVNQGGNLPDAAQKMGLDIGIQNSKSQAPQPSALQGARPSFYPAARYR